MRPHNPKAPAFVRKWRSVMAVGCTHGELAHPERLAEVLAFKTRFQPEIRFDLGDWIDIASFRGGAAGTPDESRSIEPDKLAAVAWIQQYSPTHITHGNHDWRIYERQFHHTAIIAECSRSIWNEVQATIRSVGAWQLPYNNTASIFMGGVHWLHGTMYGENALRDHAEQFGGPVVHAHTHRAESAHGRTTKESGSHSVGTLADVKRMTYAERRRSTTRWSAGCLFGEMCETESKLWLARNKTQDEIVTPGTDLFKPPMGVDGWQTQVRIPNPIIFPPGC